MDGTVFVVGGLCMRHAVTMLCGACVTRLRTSLMILRFRPKEGASTDIYIPLLFGQVLLFWYQDFSGRWTNSGILLLFEKNGGQNWRATRSFH